MAPRLGLVNATFFPPILRSSCVLGGGLLLSGDLAEHTLASLFVHLADFLLAIIDQYSAWSRHRLVEAGFRVSQSACWNCCEIRRHLRYLPVFILLLGLGETSKIAIVFYACAFPLLLNTISGVKNVDPLLIKSARSMGLSPVRYFAKSLSPLQFRRYFVGIRQAGAGSILVLVAAEMVGAKSGSRLLNSIHAFSFQITNDVRRYYLDFGDRFNH